LFILIRISGYLDPGRFGAPTGARPGEEYYANLIQQVHKHISGFPFRTLGF
jgi:hypothetical protein